MAYWHRFMTTYVDGRLVEEGQAGLFTEVFLLRMQYLNHGGRRLGKCLPIACLRAISAYVTFTSRCLLSIARSEVNLGCRIIFVLPNVTIVQISIYIQEANT